jgi:enamine deaminase RidA (YjgF/YER057c/UK114 family)
MRSVVLAVTITSLAAWPVAAWGQMGGFGGRGGMGEPGFGRRAEGSAPKLPGPELEGPPDSATIQPVLHLDPEQTRQYAAAYEAFMLATKPQRDSAHAIQDDMYQKLDGGDRAAALFYAEKLQRIGDWLKDQQEQFEDHLSKIFTGDQMKAYRQWRKDQDRAAEAKAREDATRWRMMPFGGLDRPAAEAKTFVDDTGLPRADAGSQAVRVGRTVYVSSQVAVDDAGNIVGGNDLQAQATQAFANLTRVLGAANALPEDVVRLTIYVVGYRPADLDVIRQAGAAYFPAHHQPVVTVLGVESLSREGLLVAVEATAVQGKARGPVQPSGR